MRDEEACGIALGLGALEAGEDGEWQTGNGAGEWTGDGGRGCFYATSRFTSLCGPSFFLPLFYLIFFLVERYIFFLFFF